MDVPKYLERGSGDEALVLLHGIGGCADVWEPQLAAFSSRYRVVAWYMPGYGGSPPLPEMTFPALADALAALIDRLDTPRVHLVGHSMGGAIALAVAARRRDLVASLSLIATAGLGPEINAAFIDAFVRAGRRREAQEALAMLVHDPALVSRAMVEETLRYKRLDGVAAALATVAGAWFAGGRQLLDLRPALAALRMPAQLIWGGGDRIIPVAHAEALTGNLPVHIIEAAGHLPHMEKSGEVNRLIGRFLATNP